MAHIEYFNFNFLDLAFDKAYQIDQYKVLAFIGDPNKGEYPGSRATSANVIVHNDDIQTFSRKRVYINSKGMYFIGEENRKHYIELS